MFDRHFKSNHLIQDIAYKHGFNHFPHFIALFNKKYGITPGQIRIQESITSISII